MCYTLITRAKVLANGNKLKIVLVSSKGTVIPLLKLLSTVNRAIVYEIGDIEKKKATQYIIKMGIMKDGADEVVNCVGGRLVYLQGYMKIVGNISNTNDICKNTKTQNTKWSRGLSYPLRAQRTIHHWSHQSSTHGPLTISSAIFPIKLV